MCGGIGVIIGSRPNVDGVAKSPLGCVVALCRIPTRTIVALIPENPQPLGGRNFDGVAKSPPYYVAVLFQDFDILYV